MKHLKEYMLFESLDGSQITIGEFLQRIDISPSRMDEIIKWWNENRSNIKIHFFPFKSIQPIAGVFLGTDTICVNEKMQAPPHIRLFLALHESRHCDQYMEGGFMEGYHDTVVNGDLENFLTYYREAEEDANIFAINGLREMGFNREMDMAETMLRRNEEAGNMVYNMMTRDINRLRPTDFFDLLKKQIM